MLQFDVAFQIVCIWTCFLDLVPVTVSELPATHASVADLHQNLTGAGQRPFRMAGAHSIKGAHGTRF